jgi:hypothetical protein
MESCHGAALWRTGWHFAHTEETLLLGWKQKYKEDEGIGVFLYKQGTEHPPFVSELKKILYSNLD